MLSPLMKKALEEFDDSGEECCGGLVTHCDIMMQDMTDELQHIGNRIMSGELSFNDIETFRKAYQRALETRIEGVINDEY